jgi:16S rRNA (cytidine1402-2'-O)-methyltransferase
MLRILNDYSTESSVSSQTGTLYVVATPIGNLDDISVRARSVLSAVAVIAAEDTRRSGRLLDLLGIKGKLLSCHEHNEAGRVPELIARLQAGEDVALISDAGTPLLSDPGYRLVSAVAEQGILVSPIPGCSAAIAALSVAGLPTDAVLFVGFLPSGESRRKTRLQELSERTETLVIYESVHRIAAVLVELAEILGSARQAVAARELTKLHETIYRGALADLGAQVAADPGGGKGEYTLVIAGATQAAPDVGELDRVLQVLLGYMGVRQAAEVVGKLLNIKKNMAYKRALELRESSDDSY